LGNKIEYYVQDHKHPIDDNQLPKIDFMLPMDECSIKDNGDTPPPRSPSVVMEELPECCLPKEPNPYVNKKIKLIADFPYCEEHSVMFSADTVIDIDEIETNNVHDFVIKINGEVQSFEDEVTLQIGDEVFINISREDEYGDSSLTIVGTDPDTIIDTRIDYESELDAPTMEEDIYVNKKGTE
jgi:hypothetical protein